MAGKRKLACNMLWLCIDQVDEVRLSGKFYTCLEHQEYAFYDFDQLVLQADGLFDQIEFPQSFQTKRSFQEERKEHDFVTSRTFRSEGQEDVTYHKGNVFTGVILVSTRQFSNWQGIVMNECFEKMTEFYDVIELMNQLIELAGKQKEIKA